MRNDVPNKIEKEVSNIKIIDTHEHLQKEKNRLKSGADPFILFASQYLSSDLISSGMSYEDLSKLIDERVSLSERWNIFSTYWDNVQNTSYAKSIMIAIRDLYGIEKLDKRTILELARKMKAMNKQGLYRWILKENAGIEIALHDTILKPQGYDFWNVMPVDKIIDVDRSLFVPVHRFHDFILITERADLNSLSRRINLPIHTLDDLLNAFRMEFENISSKIYAIKIWIAYRRSIFFDKVTFSEAEKAFNEIFRQQSFKRMDIEGMRLTFPESISFELAKPLQDYMVHELIRLSIRYKLPIQIHTGIHEGNENMVSNSNPLNLTNLFVEYKEARFDIFHAGYPFLDETATLVKNFPNVYVDLCWLHLLSPSIARRVIYEWLDLLPSNKIMGFGGDYLFVEGSYGHSVIARQNIVSVLQKKIEEKSLKFEEAKKLAKKLLRDNALDLFFNEKPLHRS
jgi:predicted TIM-barrel fold metal-dependent hydrolase